MQLLSMFWNDKEPIKIFKNRHLLACCSAIFHKLKWILLLLFSSVESINVIDDTAQGEFESGSGPGDDPWGTP